MFARSPDQIDGQHDQADVTRRSTPPSGIQPMIVRRVPLERNESSGDWEPELLLQPETRPISHEQLVVEVKGIYAGLVMVEAKCIDIDERQSAAAREQNPSRKTKLLDDQWQSLITLHKQLLHEHHDFFLASQHPSASQALSRLAAKYSMPARMWRHGIHAFLEVLRHRLPDSLEHMLAFIYIAYSMMALLYETVPAFGNTWIECLGDLGKYRIAIDEDGARDREVWSNVANSWYNKVSDKNPHVGRLYHHMAILARPYTLDQLSLCARALTCTSPPMSARASIMLLFAPVVNTKIDYGEPLLSEVVKGILCPLHNNPPNFLTGRHNIPIPEDYARRMNTVDWLSNHWRCPRTLLTPDATNDRKRTLGQESWHAPDLESIPWLGLAATEICLIVKTVHLRKHAITLRRFYHDVVAWIASLSTDDATSTWAISRRKCYFRRPTILAFISVALPSTGASPVGKPANAEGRTSVGSFPFAALGCVVFALATLFVAQYLAPRKGPICVWGCVMAGSAYSWLMVRSDPTTTLALSTPVFGVWTISTLQYGHMTFRELGIADAVSLLVILTATAINLSLVRFMTPTGVPISQADLISVSLPSVSATLASIVNLVALIRGSVAQQRIVQSSDSPETRASSDREDTDSDIVMEELPAIHLSEAPGELYELPSAHGLSHEVSVLRTAPPSLDHLFNASMHYLRPTSMIERCRTLYRKLKSRNT